MNPCLFCLLTTVWTIHSHTSMRHFPQCAGRPHPEWLQEGHFQGQRKSSPDALCHDEVSLFHSPVFFLPPPEPLGVLQRPEPIRAQYQVCQPSAQLVRWPSPSSVLPSFPQGCYCLSCNACPDRTVRQMLEPCSSRLSSSPGLGRMASFRQSSMAHSNASLNRRVRGTSGNGVDPGLLMEASDDAPSDRLPTLIWEEEDDTSAASRMDSK